MRDAYILDISVRTALEDDAVVYAARDLAALMDGSQVGRERLTQADDGLKPARMRCRRLLGSAEQGCRCCRPHLQGRTTLRIWGQPSLEQVQGVYAAEAPSTKTHNISPKLRKEWLHARTPKLLSM